MALEEFPIIKGGNGKNHTKPLKSFENTAATNNRSIPTKIIRKDKKNSLN
jgi:hypothetical protein